jgi:glycosyltransferase involved in cell wall biosynthesis
MPKVAFLSPRYFDDRSCVGGGERYPLNLARGVVEATAGEYAVEVISFGLTSARRRIKPGVTLRVLEVAAEPRDPLDAVSWELAEAIADADLVHIHQAYTRCSEVGLLVAKQQRKPVCVTDHGAMTSTLGLDHRHLELVDAIVAQSDFAAAQFRCNRPTFIVKGGVDTTQFKPARRPAPRDRVLCVARLAPHKGIDGLITALPDHLPLTIAGRGYDGRYFEKLEELAEGKDVEFITDADDPTILNLYRRAWVNVLPSVYRDCFGTAYAAPELMGLALLEAMACGTPAVCSRVAAMPEFIRDGETGFIFDDLDQLAELLERLARDAGLVEQIGRNARRAVEEEYSLAVAGRQLVAVYQPLIAARRGVAA